MWPGFWKASLISLAGYTAAVLIGFGIDFRFTLAAVPILQIGWWLFCTVRIVQLRRSGAHKAGSIATDRESYGFALGGLISSSVLLVALVVLTQAD